MIIQFLPVSCEPNNDTVTEVLLLTVTEVLSPFRVNFFNPVR